MKWRVKILSRMSRALTFLCEFLRRPTQIGAVAPSSQALAREMVEQAKVREAEVIVEFGAGTGVMTKEIERCRSANSHFFSIEQNPTLVEILRQELPQVDLCCQSAADLPQLLRERQLTEIQAIVSGLPWAAFPDKLQDELLQPAVDSLVTGGRFVTFAYLQGLLLPSGRHFAHKIGRVFKEVRKSRIIWNNLPPAFVYVCTK